jgi:large subunit ribosomal protein L4
MSALSAKAKEKSIYIVEDMTLETHKTKNITDLLGNLKVDGMKTLFVLPEYNDNVYLSFRNVPYVIGTLLSDINTYDVVNADVLILTEAAAKIFSEIETETEA